MISTLLAGAAVSRQQKPEEETKEAKKRRLRREGRRARKKAAGLPDEATLKDLAKQYLEIQHRLWPALDSSLLPQYDEANAEKLANEFRQRFNNTATIPVVPAKRAKGLLSLAAAYLRYSSDVSNVLSLVQQLRLILERARLNGHFIPWEYIFADAAISGTTPHRRGYQMAKATVVGDEHASDVLYIDEIGRASRYAIESLRLGRSIERYRKRLIGVSDGFDSLNVMSKQMLSMFAMMQEWFVDQLRSKVGRGLREALLRGNPVRPPGFGYVRIPVLDEQGSVRIHADGRPMTQLAVNPEESGFIIEAYILFVERRWSLTKIAREFNCRGVGGMAWDFNSVSDLLRRHTHTGILVDGQTMRVFDDEKECWVRQKRPRREWRVKRAPKLKIVEYRLWKAAQRRLAEIKAAYSRKPGEGKRRVDVYRTRLVRPLCGSCGRPLYIGHSGKHPSFTCSRGRTEKNGCSFRGHKSVAIIENCVLGHVMNNILTGDVLQELVAKANVALAEELAKPKPDLTAKKQELQKLKRKMDRLREAIEEEEEGEVIVIVARRKELAEQCKALSGEIAAHEDVAFEPTPLSVESLTGYLTTLRELLMGDVAEAAEMLEKITGPVVVHQEKQEGGRPALWTAEFRVNLLPVIAELSRKAEYPTARVIDQLHTRSWTFEIPCSVRLEKLAKYMQIAAEAGKLHSQGLLLEDLSRRFDVDAECVRMALEYARTGRRQRWPSQAVGGPANDTKAPRACKARRFAPEIARLRDEDGLTFLEICRVIEQRHQETLCEFTARRAYFELHPNGPQDVVRATTKVKGKPKSRLTATTRSRVQDLLSLGTSVAAIAKGAGVSTNTVQRIKQEMKREGT